MSKQVAQENPQPGAARGKEGGPAPEGAEAELYRKSGEEFAYVQPIRRTRMGGLTKAIAVCEVCGVVRPYHVRYSKSGTHGEAYYAHRHPLVFLLLERSNTGRNSFAIDGQPSERVRRVLEAVGQAWERHRTSLEAAYEDIVSELGETFGEAEEASSTNKSRGWGVSE
jgi:hypothetical protein